MKDEMPYHAIPNRRHITPYHIIPHSQPVAFQHLPIFHFGFDSTNLPTRKDLDGFVLFHEHKALSFTHHFYITPPLSHLNNAGWGMRDLLYLAFLCMDEGREGGRELNTNTNTYTSINLHNVF